MPHNRHFQPMPPLEHVLRDESSVRVLQKCLDSAGFHNTNKDDRGLRKALQEWAGVKPTGVLNAASMNAIRRQLEENPDDPIARSLAEQLAHHSPASLRVATSRIGDATQGAIHPDPIAGRDGPFSPRLTSDVAMMPVHS